MNYGAPRDFFSLPNMTSEFRNFSNMDMERTLQRGYTWGALTIINSQGFGCMVGLNGYYSVVRVAGTNLAMTPDQRCNSNDGNEKTGEDETNVVRFSGSKGTCRRLALYDLTKDSQGGYTLYGISVPVSDDNTEAAFTATEATFNRTFNKGYSTLCLPYAAALPEGMRAYRFVGRTVRDGDYTYSFTSANSLEAHVPYLIHCEQAGLKIGDASHVEVKAATRYTIGDAIASPATGDGFVGTLSAVSHDDALGHNIYTLNATRQQWLRINGRKVVIK